MKAKAKAAKPGKPVRTPEEQAVVDRYMDKPRLMRPPKIAANAKPDKDGTLDAPKGVHDPELFAARLALASGIDDPDLSGVLLSQLAQVVHRPGQEVGAVLNTAMAGLHAIAPRDATEGLLAAQMLASHHAAMNCFRLAAIPEQLMPARDTFLRHAGKLSRLYADQMLALAKYRNRGQQTVRVEHVTVNGPAIVGNVTPGPGGAATKIEGQAHANDIAALTFAPGEALPCPDTFGRDVPATSHAERPLQNARRQVTGGT